MVVDQCNVTGELQQVSLFPSLFIPQGKRSVWAVRHGMGHAVGPSILLSLVSVTIPLFSYYYDI